MMNTFLCSKHDSLPPSLITCYTDVICLFASNINNSDLAAVVLQSLGSLLVEVGVRFANSDQWVEVIEQISLLF